MIRSEPLIRELSLPDPAEIGSVAELEPHVQRTFDLLAEADDGLTMNGRLSDAVVLDKIDDIRTNGQLYVELDPDTNRIRGALHGSLRPCGTTYDIELLAVDRLHRKKGIGRELLSQAERSARVFGASVLSLQAINTPGVITFYTKEGFQPLLSHSRHYMPMARTL